MADINIIEMMRAAGAQLAYLDTDTPYFQYGRTYRGIESRAIERLDRRVVIYVHAPDDVQLIFYPYYMDENPHVESRDFRSLNDALNWAERNIK